LGTFDVHRLQLGRRESDELTAFVSHVDLLLLNLLGGAGTDRIMIRVAAWLSFTSSLASSRATLALMCYQPPVTGADPVRRPGAGCLALHSIDKQIGQGVDDVAAPRAAQTAAVEQPCRRVTESRRNRSNALGEAFRSGGTGSSNPASSSAEMVWGRRRGNGTIVAVAN
jgi:hypothetical protein